MQEMVQLESVNVEEGEINCCLAVIRYFSMLNEEIKF